MKLRTQPKQELNWNEAGCLILKLVLSLYVIEAMSRKGSLTLKNVSLYFIFLKAESHSMKNQQMDPFTRRQCKPTIVSNVSKMQS